MRRIRWIVMVIGVLLMGLVGTAHGTVKYTLTDMSNGEGTNLWQFDYTVTNTTVDKTFNSFLIYFDYGAYNTLLDTSTNTTYWTTDVVQPYLNPSNSLIPGFFSAMAQSPYLGIAPGDSASGFSVLFVSTGPTLQNFEIYDSGNNLVDWGTTSAVPEPTTWALLAISLGVVSAARMKMHRNRTEPIS